MEDCYDTIDGQDVTKMVLKSTRGYSTCSMCGFNNWTIGDVKYIVEYDHKREHLCPACAVERGLPYDSWYHKNQNAPFRSKKDIPNADASEEEEEETTRKCDNCYEGDSSFVENKNYFLSGIIKLESKANGSSKTRCLACALATGLIEVPRQKRPAENTVVAPAAKTAKTNTALDMEQVLLKLEKQVEPINACRLVPHPTTALFVAWNGVIVLVWEGFPPSLCCLKEGLQAVVPNLKPENFGSKWPKTTLAAVNDEAPDLSLQEFQELKAICQKHSKKIVKHATTAILIQSISAVEYSCRSLENFQARATPHATLLLEAGYAEETGGDVETTNLFQEASNEEKARTNSVVQEWEDSKAYLEKLNAPGSRISSYRQDSPSGATCVAFLGQPLKVPLRQILGDFRGEIEERFPGRYAWLKEESLHCTLRSLAQMD